MNAILSALTNAGLLLLGHNQTEIMLRGSSSSDSLTLGLQKCQNSNTWTLHGTFFAFFCIFKTHKKNNEFTGVWPEKENCGGSSFDESQVQDLLSDMKVYWLSCPEFPNTDTEFWTHEWSKHGSCSGMSQHEYFSDGLALRSKYASLCDGQSGNSCSLDCDGYDGPCRN